MNITYVVHGRRTSESWCDQANLRVTHGPAEELARLHGDEINDVPRIAIAWFIKEGVKPGDTTHFITVLEEAEDGTNMGSRIFTPSDFMNGSSLGDILGAGKRDMIAISEQLVENGRKRGVFKRDSETLPPALQGHPDLASVDLRIGLTGAMNDVIDAAFFDIVCGFDQRGTTLMLSLDHLFEGVIEIESDDAFQRRFAATAVVVADRMAQNEPFELNSLAEEIVFAAALTQVVNAIPDDMMIDEEGADGLVALAERFLHNEDLRELTVAMIRDEEYNEDLNDNILAMPSRWYDDAPKTGIVASYGPAEASYISEIRFGTT